MEISRTHKPMSNRALKREIAKAIATIKFNDKVVIEEKRSYNRQAHYKSGSWVTVKPRAKVTDSRYYKYNKGDYTINKSNGLWLWYDRVNNF